MNIWFFTVTVVFGSGIVFLWIRTDRAIWPAAILSLTMTVFTRAAQHLGSHTPHWQDGYLYWSATEAILTHGSLTVPDTAWNARANVYLEFPAYHIFSAAFTDIAGVDSEVAMAFVPVLLSIVIFFLSWKFFQLLLGKRWGMLAAYVLVMLEALIGHTTQFHQQGLGYLTFIAIILVLTRYRASGSEPRIVVIFFAFSALAAISHRFTSIVIAALLLTVGMVSVGFERVSNLHSNQFSKSATNLTIVGVITIMIIHISVSSSFLSFGITSVFTSTTVAPGPAPGVVAEGATFVDWFPLVNKVVLAILAFPVVIYSMFRKNHQTKRWYVTLGLGLAIITLPMFAASEAGTWARLAALGYILIVPVSFVTLRRIDGWNLSGNSVAVGVAIVCLILMGTLAGVVPSLIDHNADIRDDGFHKIQPIGEQDPKAGDHIDRYISPEETIGFRFWTRIVVLYHGQHPNAGYVDEVNAALVVYDNARTGSPPQRASKIYTNGRIRICSSE